MSTSNPLPAGSLTTRAGFTLVEVVVALVLASIFATVVFQLIRGQGAFVAVQTARQEVQQNARAAVEIIGSELRATLPHGLIRADGASIEFMSPRFFALVCPGANAGQMDVIAPSVDAAALTAGATTGLMVDVSGTATPSYVPAAAGGVAPRATISTITSLAPGLGQCSTMNAQGTGFTAYRLTGTGFPTGVAGFDVGRTVVVYDVVRYAVGTSEGLQWVQRWNPTSTATPQPFVGPVIPNEGLAFRYFAANSSTPMAAPVDNGAALRSVSRIRVVVGAQSRGTSSRLQQTERDSVTVFLRNQ